jgi:hypothetical protein
MQAINRCVPEDAFCWLTYAVHARLQTLTSPPAGQLPWSPHLRLSLRKRVVELSAGEPTHLRCH